MTAPPRAGLDTYTNAERRRSIIWKHATPALPNDARRASGYGASGLRQYDFCLPPEYAKLSLLPEVRTTALDLFAELGIPWHAGIADGPSNHLLDSQVQCVNALGQMVHDPERILRAFGDVLNIDEVLQIEPGRFLTFEYIGPKDYFHEAPGRQRIRGTKCTSVDAAFLHRSRSGQLELVLIEWKYTESYAARKPDPGPDATRLKRYGPAWCDPKGPVRSDLLTFADALDEPFYQLVRQQLLAHALEVDPEVPVDRVRVLHVLSPRNLAYHQSMHRPAARALGASVNQVWRRLLNEPDRFISVDSSIFLNSALTSDEYVRRYGPV